MFEAEGRPKSGKTVFIRSYGCQMNVYDSERMAELLKPHGYRPVDAPEAADLVILNTCHIREKAAEKVFSDLGRLKPLKEESRARGRDLTVAVAGCVAQAEGAEIQRRAPLVDLVFGPQTYHRLPELLARRERSVGAVIDTEFAAEEKFDALARDRDAPGVAAFVTVQEGCDKFCTFCVVPYTRGAEVSRSASAIENEVRSLVSKGVCDVTLLGQNVNAWRSAPANGAGLGIRANADGSWGLGQLCRHLAGLDGLQRLTFTTSHPRDMDDALIEAFATVEKLMPFLHLPVQSGSDRILAAMNRGHTAADYLAVLDRLRRTRPGIALSGDFIVGFPGETTEDFEQTLALIERVEYASAYCFKYSRRPGTPAASMGRQVAEPEKEGRLARLLSLIEAQRRIFNSRFVGECLPVLFDRPGRRNGQLVGRSPHLQSVHAVAPQSMLGKIASVRVVGASGYALSGELITAPRDQRAF
ncbi:MAG: tRNA (N6-isopentenyl adenosine(37)-C2)-methylthiotransferase MiaB [Parvularculaceae bacterium]